MKSPETLFTETTLDIIIPNGVLQFTEEEAEKILTAKPRTLAFYDEHIDFYLILRLPSDSGISDVAAAKAFFHQLEIVVEAGLVDSTVVTQPQPAPLPVYRLPPGRSRSNSAATSPSRPSSPLPGTAEKKQPKVDGTVIFQSVYNPKTKDKDMIVFIRNDAWCCIVPLSVPVAYVKTRAQMPALALATIVSQRVLPEKPTNSDYKGEYDDDNFNMINLLAGLSDDPSLSEASKYLPLPASRIYGTVESRRQSIYPNTPGPMTPQPLRRSFRKILPVKSALNVRMRTTSVSPLDNVLMMSVELENNTDAGTAFDVQEVRIELSSAIVAQFDWGGKKEIFPLILHPVDQVTFLYSIAILEESAKTYPQYYPISSLNHPSSRRSSVTSTPPPAPNAEDKQRHVSIIVRGSPIVDGQSIKNVESRWNCMLDLSNLRRQEDSLPPNLPGIVGSRLSMSMINQKPSGYQTPSISRPGTGSVTPTPTKSSYGEYATAYGRNKRGLPMIPDNDIANYGSNGVLDGGRTPAKRHVEHDVDGVVVSFSVDSKVIIGKVFTITVFIVNRSKHVRRFTVVVPNRRRPSESAKNLPPIPVGVKSTTQNNQLEPYMEETEFLRRHTDFGTNETGIICLENNVRIGPLSSSTCETTKLHFIAIRESLHVIDLIQLVDNDTGFITNLRSVLEVYVGRE
ncbi:4329_t:CDS:2 [Paraglomus brasilianum]|uniref:4329_t:CDS:1 n=1 Tax=Paraglomus brasilianum TaxID=144538 RepID=A0A9N8ZXQ2_9GLOM|nr:4329_t:CDS:2 [Paraglomus brasilianum]